MNVFAVHSSFVGTVACFLDVQRPFLFVSLKVQNLQLPFSASPSKTSQESLGSNSSHFHWDSEGSLFWCKAPTAVLTYCSLIPASEPSESCHPWSYPCFPRADNCPTSTTKGSNCRIDSASPSPTPRLFFFLYLHCYFKFPPISQ